MKKYVFIVCLFCFSGIVRSNVLLSNQDTLMFSYSKVEAGQMSIDVSFKGSDIVNSLDLSMKYNIHKLTYDTLKQQVAYLDLAWGYVNPVDTTLRVTSYSSTKNYSPNKIILSLIFLTNVSVTYSDFYSINGYLNGNQVPVKLIESTQGVAEINNDKMIKVYPNPANDILNVEVDNIRFMSYSLSLFDMNGKQIFTKTFFNSGQRQEIDVKNFANGIYYVKIYNNKFL